MRETRTHRPLVDGKPWGKWGQTGRDTMMGATTFTVTLTDQELETGPPWESTREAFITDWVDRAANRYRIEAALNNPGPNVIRLAGRVVSRERLQQVWRERYPDAAPLYLGRDDPWPNQPDQLQFDLWRLRAEMEWDLDRVAERIDGIARAGDRALARVRWSTAKLPGESAIQYLMRQSAQMFTARMLERATETLAGGAVVYQQESMNDLYREGGPVGGPRPHWVIPPDVFRRNRSDMVDAMSLALKDPLALHTPPGSELARLTLDDFLDPPKRKPPT